LEPLQFALRTDLVAESNQIEGYDWPLKAVRRVVREHDELLKAPVHNFMNGLRSDRRVYEALGLYRAHLVAEEWALDAHRPREYQVRELHALITAGEDFAGRYKHKPNKISLSLHTPTEPIDVPRAMQELVDWWRAADGDPILHATVVHAWLTHIHPFDDGNGRMARLLANVTLVQAGYPPLILRSNADKGQYCDALAMSDQGDILPLYELFAGVVARTVGMMSRDGYVEEIIQDRFLASLEAKYLAWTEIAMAFLAALSNAVEHRRGKVTLQGILDIASFELLTGPKPSSDGNGWCAKVATENANDFLLWFGYPSNILIDLNGGKREACPSVFISIRSDNRYARRPYTLMKDEKVPTEISIRPVVKTPVLLRWEYRSDELSVADAAELLATAFSKYDRYNPRRDDDDSYWE
jgi:Fic family protein